MIGWMLVNNSVRKCLLVHSMLASFAFSICIRVNSGLWFSILMVLRSIHRLKLLWFILVIFLLHAFVVAFDIAVGWWQWIQISPQHLKLRLWYSPNLCLGFSDIALAATWLALSALRCLSIVTLQLYIHRCFHLLVLRC